MALNEKSLICLSENSNENIGYIMWQKNANRRNTLENKSFSDNYNDNCDIKSKDTENETEQSWQPPSSVSLLYRIIFISIVWIFTTVILFVKIGRSIDLFPSIIYFPMFGIFGFLEYAAVPIGWFTYILLTIILIQVRRRKYFIISICILILLVSINIIGCNFILNAH